MGTCQWLPRLVVCSDAPLLGKMSDPAFFRSPRSPRCGSSRLLAVPITPFNSTAVHAAMEEEPLLPRGVCRLSPLPVCISSKYSNSQKRVNVNSCLSLKPLSHCTKNTTYYFVFVTNPVLLVKTLVLCGVKRVCVCVCQPCD